MNRCAARESLFLIILSFQLYLNASRTEQRRRHPEEDIHHIYYVKNIFFKRAKGIVDC